MARTGKTRTPKLRTYRLRNGLTQDELAEQLGTGRSTIAWLESTNSNRKPGRDLAGRIAKLIGCQWWTVIEEYDQLRRAS